MCCCCVGLLRCCIHTESAQGPRARVQGVGHDFRAAAAQMQGSDSAMDMSGIGGEAGAAGELDSTRKLVILGLPWDTTEGSLERHFSQIGPLQARRFPFPSCWATRRIACRALCLLPFTFICNSH